ncbi:MAG: hypothetical protein U9N59_13695, partial [Campylobacterota bacterium]|nr:hypothetical protein [Campylobacterota bacterium]
MKKETYLSELISIVNQILSILNKIDDTSKISLINYTPNIYKSYSQVTLQKEKRINDFSNNSANYDFQEKESIFRKVGKGLNIFNHVLGSVSDELHDHKTEQAIERLNDSYVQKIEIKQSIDKTKKALEFAKIDTKNYMAKLGVDTDINYSWLVSQMKVDKVIMKDGEYIELFDKYMELKSRYKQLKEDIFSIIQNKVKTFLKSYLVYFKDFAPNIKVNIDLDNALYNTTHLELYNDELPYKDDLVDTINTLNNEILIVENDLKFLHDSVHKYETIDINRYKNIIQNNHNNYDKYIQNIENIKFEKIRKYCEKLSKENQADDMQKYLGEKGRMYKALIYSTLEEFIENLNGETITLCDWGCSQGIASMLVLDYIKEKQLNIKVSDVILMDDEIKVLSRAMAQVEALAQDDMKISAIKSDDNTIYDKIKTTKNNTALHLFANDKMPIDFLEIELDIFDKDFVLCVSNENKEFINEVYENFKDFMDVRDLSTKDGKIGRFAKFERVF